MSATPLAGFIALLTFIMQCIDVSAQYKKLKTIKLSNPVQYAALDRPGELYIVFSDGKISRYNTNGVLAAEGKLHQQPLIVDPRDGAKIFAYYGNSKTYSFLYSSLTSYNLEDAHIDESFAIAPFLVAAWGDQHVLVLDSADWTAKKIHINTNTIEREFRFEAPLKGNHSLRYAREYQNFIFLQDNSNVYLINSFGKLLKTISLNGTKHFSFVGEELYFPQGKELVFFDLFTAETRKSPLPEAGDFVLLSDERLFIIQRNTVHIYTINQ